jgi:hypothetical protein
MGADGDTSPSLMIPQWGLHPITPTGNPPPSISQRGGGYGGIPPSDTPKGWGLRGHTPEKRDFHPTSKMNRPIEFTNDE